MPLETWKDYLRVHLLDEAADVLPRAFADEALAMRSAVSGRPPATRADRALEATQMGMGNAIGRMYAERYFSPAQKARVEGIVANVAAAFRRHVEAATWLEPATRTMALAKLRSLYVGVGYPEHWEDDADLAVDPADALGNHRRVLERRHRQALARLGRPVDLRQWWIAPQAAGAVLVFQQNVYDFAAGLLQPTKFDSTASDAANYGAIGAIIGHDISHYVDVLGADYDTVFAERHWWTTEDMTRFEAVAEPLVRQFSGYRPFPDLAVNGRLTRTENVADLAGLTAAFEAYRAQPGRRNARHREGPATGPAVLYRVGAQLARDDHRTWPADPARDGSRAGALPGDTVRNLDAWYDAFDVRPGQRLYLEPAARVRVW